MSLALFPTFLELGDKSDMVFLVSWLCQEMLDVKKINVSFFINFLSSDSNKSIFLFAYNISKEQKFM